MGVLAFEVTFLFASSTVVCAQASQGGSPQPLPEAPVLVPEPEPKDLYDVTPSAGWSRFVVLTDLGLGLSVDRNDSLGGALMLRTAVGVEHQLTTWSVVPLLAVELVGAATSALAASAIVAFIHDSMLEAHVGASIALDGLPGGFAAIGYGLFSLEMQRRGLVSRRRDRGPWLMFIKLTLPVFVGRPL